MSIDLVVRISVGRFSTEIQHAYNEIILGEDQDNVEVKIFAHAYREDAPVSTESLFDDDRMFKIDVDTDTWQIRC